MAPSKFLALPEKNILQNFLFYPASGHSKSLATRAKTSKKKKKEIRQKIKINKDKTF